MMLLNSQKKQKQEIYNLKKSNYIDINYIMSPWSINETLVSFILFWFVSNHPIKLKFYDFFCKG
jgi:hypothetical protein